MSQVHLRNGSGRRVTDGELVRLAPQKADSFVVAGLSDFGIIGTVSGTILTGQIGTINLINTVSYADILNTPLTFPPSPHTHSFMEVKLIDENGDSFGLFHRDGTLVFMDRSVYEIIKGNSFTVCDTVEANTTTVKWQIHTLADIGKIHLRFSLTCNGEALYLVTEGSDRDDGTALEEVNRNRVLPSLAETIVTRTPTGGTTDGATVLFSLRNGLLNKPGGVAIEGEMRGQIIYGFSPLILNMLFRQLLMQPVM